MSDRKTTQTDAIPVAKLSFWLTDARTALINHGETDVPCGECNACCRSSYFIHIKPEETQTIAQIPKELMFAAPGFPKGHVLLGYDKDGCCPMFIDSKCSIYEYRPQTCRQYDCRIFPATGLTVGDDKPLISQQEKRWRFNLSTRDERKLLSALQAAAKFLTTYSKLFPTGFVPGNATQQAILAIKIYDVFLRDDFMLENSEGSKQSHDIATAIRIAYEKFERGENNA